MLAKIYKSIMFILIIGILVVISYFMNSMIELVVMLTCFLISKQKYEFKYHCKSSFHCLLLSVGIFIIALRVTFPIGVSYVCSGVCGLVVTYLGQYTAESRFIREDYAYIEPKYNSMIEEKNHINVWTMDEPSLRGYCRTNLLDDIDEEIVVQRLLYHRKGKDLYNKIGYSKPQMIRREQRIEAKLNIKLKDH